MYITSYLLLYVCTGDVLTEAEDMKLLAQELRAKILSKLDGVHEQVRGVLGDGSEL